RQARRTAARTTRAIWNAPSGVPPRPARRPNQLKRVTNTARSAASNAMNSARFGNARTKKGRSQRPYCGEYTLFTKRNVTRRGNANVHRGKLGCRTRRAHHRPPDTATSARIERRLMARGESEQPWWMRLQARYQRLSKSATRSALYRKKVS